MIEITPISTEEELGFNYEYPSYKKVGRILVEVINNEPEYKNPVYRHIYEILDYDNDSCVFYINEGVGFEYWLDEHIDFPGEGIYVIEGITGEYIRGEWGYSDDDEEWDYGTVRLATEAEITSEVLGSDSI